MHHILWFKENKKKETALRKINDNNELKINSTDEKITSKTE